MSCLIRHELNGVPCLIEVLRYIPPRRSVGMDPPESSEAEYRVLTTAGDPLTWVNGLNAGKYHWDIMERVDRYMLREQYEEDWT